MIKLNAKIELFTAIKWNTDNTDMTDSYGYILPFRMAQYESGAK